MGEIIIWSPVNLHRNEQRWLLQHRADPIMWLESEPSQVSLRHTVYGATQHVVHLSVFVSWVEETSDWSWRVFCTILVTFLQWSSETYRYTDGGPSLGHNNISKLMWWYCLSSDTYGYTYIVIYRSSFLQRNGGYKYKCLWNEVSAEGNATITASILWPLRCPYTLCSGCFARRPTVITQMQSFIPADKAQEDAAVFS